MYRPSTLRSWRSALMNLVGWSRAIPHRAMLANTLASSAFAVSMKVSPSTGELDYA